jgi:lysophospholipase L1-like esterase
VTRFPARLAAAFLVPLAAALAAEGAARARYGGAPTDTENALLWVAGSRPAFVCAADGACRTDPELVPLENPDERFSARPSSETFRVVCVGDSTTAGWPYQPRGGYPEWLAPTLRAALPGRKIEVLNLGVQAWDGARLEDVFDQALGFVPDALIVRVGYDDYQHFLLRRPRGGALGRAALKLRLFLLARSAAFRALSRGLGPAPRHGIVATFSAPLTAAEEDVLVADHAARLRAFAARARAAGVPLVALGLPHWDGFSSRFAGARALGRQQRATAETALSLGLPFAALDEIPDERFIDAFHVDDEGERLVARDVARALADAGLPEPAARWRWSRIPPPNVLERRLRLDEPDYRTHLESRLANFFDEHEMHDRAARHLADAMILAENADMLPEELRRNARPSMAALYREVFARLRREGRAAEPTQPENRAFAGL